MKKITFLLAVLLLFTRVGFTQIISTATGGNWSDNNTWIGATIPTSTDAVIIANGATVIIDVDAFAQTLQVGEGISGSLQFESTSARTLSVDSLVYISVGAVLRTANIGNQQGHELIVNGSLLNDGSLDLSTNNNFAGATLFFTGTENDSLSGNGDMTDIQRLTIDKGVDRSAVLEIKPANFSFEDATITSAIEPGFLRLLNGTCKIGGTFSMQNGWFVGSLNYTIPPTAGIWFANPNVTVLPRAGTAYIEGTLIMDAGVYNVGTQINNRLGYIDGTVITIHGGVINVASRFSATSTFGITYTQTGGTLTVNTVGSTSNSYASFDIRDFDNSSFTMSGGQIILQNPSSGLNGPRDYQNRPINVNITGGQLLFGNAQTPASPVFYVQGVMPEVTYSSIAGGNSIRLFGLVQAYGNSTIALGSNLILDNGTTGYAYIQLGTALINQGTVSGNISGSQLHMNGAVSANQYSGSGTITGTLASFRMSNPFGVNFNNSAPAPIVCEELIMNGGDVFLGNNLMVLGTGVNATGNFSYTSGTLVGRFKRWIAPQTGAIDFPVGVAGFTRNARIDFTTASSAGGSLTTQWISLPGGSNGLPLTEGLNSISNSSFDGYWQVLAGDGLTGGIYTATFQAIGLPTIIDYTQLVLLKRSDAVAPWTLDGVHVPTTGSNSAAVLSRTGMTGFSEFGIGGSVISLPIAINYFKGNRVGVENRLNWKITCTNTPSATLTLERSSESGAFIAIHTEQATALRCLQPFSYHDRSAYAAVNLYRLALTDADGRKTYSEILTLGGLALEWVSLQPNPVQAHSVLMFNLPVAGDVQMVITDQLGRKVHYQQVQLQAGQNQVPLSLNHLSKGSFQLALYFKGQLQETIGFVK